MVLAFGLVIGLGFRKIVKDGESLADLSPEPPPEAAELDDVREGRA